MAERLKYQKTDAEVKILEHAMRHDERPEVRQRAPAIRRVHLGNHPTAGAEVMAVRLPILYNWQARWEKEGLEGLANRPQSGRLGMDEMTWSLAPVLRACWMKGCIQKRIPLPANQEKKHGHVFGAYNWMMAQRKNSEIFMVFLEYLLVGKYPTGCLILVLDRAFYHQSAAAPAALSLFEHRIMVVWLPAYCTELNPIERFWGHLKDLACAN